jgi:hypothetical protein
VKEAPDAAKSGWELATEAVRDYAEKAKETGQGIGDALVSGFRGAEDAVGEFVKTGKLGMRDLVTSILADLAKVSVRRFVLAPIANALGGVLGSLGPAFASVLHAGGIAGGAGPQRLVPALAFASAPRLHGGGVAGLRPDEVPAILQRGELTTNRPLGRGPGSDSSMPPTPNKTTAENIPHLTFTPVVSSRRCSQQPGAFYPARAQQQVRRGGLRRFHEGMSWNVGFASRGGR